MDTQSLATALLEPLSVSIDRLYPITLDMYDKMADYGLFAKKDEVELLDGVLVKKDVHSSNLSDRLYRMTTDMYHGMAEHGLLSPHDKVEFLNGLLVKKMTRGAPHVTATQRLVDALNDLCLLYTSDAADE